MHVVQMQLSFTEKGVRKVLELFKHYQSSLGNSEVLDVFKVVPCLP